MILFSFPVYGLITLIKISSCTPSSYGLYPVSVFIPGSVITTIGSHECHMTLQHSHMTLQHSHIILQYSHIMHTTHTIMLAIAMETVYKRLHLASRKIVWIQRKILELCVKRRYELLSALFPSPSSLYVCRQ